jgi:hypothetical protein
MCSRHQRVRGSPLLQVHAHLLMEGLISEEVDYDDWISDSRTWLSLGKWCTRH